MCYLLGVIPRQCPAHSTTPAKIRVEIAEIRNSPCEIAVLDPETAISHGELLKAAISTRILAFDTLALSARPYVSCLLLVREALPPLRAYCTLV